MKRARSSNTSTLRITRTSSRALVQAPSDPTNAEVDLIDFQLDSEPSPYNFGVLDVMRYENESQIEQYLQSDDAGNTGQDLAFAELFTAYHHIGIDIDFSNQTFDVSVDGVPEQSLSFSPNLAECGFTVYLGVGYPDTTNPWNVFIDNFVLDQN